MRILSLALIVFGLSATAQNPSNPQASPGSSAAVTIYSPRPEHIPLAVTPEMALPGSGTPANVPMGVTPDGFGQNDARTGGQIVVYAPAAIVESAPGQSPVRIENSTASPLQGNKASRPTFETGIQTFESGLTPPTAEPAQSSLGEIARGYRARRPHEHVRVFELQGNIQGGASR